MPAQISRETARRIIVKAQGLHQARPTSPITGRQVGRVFSRMQLVQIDSVNVLSRSHYLPFFSRLGNYNKDLVDGLWNKAPRNAMEYWAHEASIIRPAHFAAMKLVRRRRWTTLNHLEDHAHLVQDIQDLLATSKPLTASQLTERLKHEEEQEKTHWGWNWNAVKTTVEHLFAEGVVTSAGRNAQFERRFTLTDRAFPEVMANAPETPEAAYDLLIEASMEAIGLATARCAADYFRLPVKETLASLDRLASSGVVSRVSVDGWSQNAYRHNAASAPRTVTGQALLSPFDPLVFERQRLERLFDFHYRIEIYTPEAKRKFGYYVLPFLLGDSLVARVDLKADRNGGFLHIKGAYREPNAPGNTAQALAAELRLMAQWLGLNDILCDPRGDLATELSHALSA